MPTTEIKPGLDAAPGDMNLMNLSGEGEAHDFKPPGISEPVLTLKDGEWGIKFEVNSHEDAQRSSIPKKALLDIATLGPSFRKKGSLLLPTEPVEYVSREALRAETLDFIRRYTTLPKPFDVVAAIFVEHTWFFDKHDSTVYFRFRHPSGGMGKSRALKTMAAVCRRALKISGNSKIAAVRRDMTQLEGTLFIDEFDTAGDRSSEWTVVLKTGFEWDSVERVCTPQSSDGWKPESFTVFGPKVTAQHHRFDDEALESRFIDCYMCDRDPSVPRTIDYTVFDREALLIRNKYLKLRFDRHEEFRVDPELASSELNDRSNQVAIPLLSLAINDEERDAIVEVMKASQNRMVQDKRGTRWGVIIGTILRVDECADGALERIYLSDVAAATSDGSIYSQTVGKCLREFGVETHHGTKGNYVVLTNQHRREFRKYLELR